MTEIASASPAAKLVFARGANTDACPDERTFRAAVAVRVGYDPFFPYAKRTVITRLDAVRGGRFRARMEILDAAGALAGEKSFVSTGQDCEELVRTLALAVSLAIDVVEAPEPPEPEPEPELAPEPEPEPSRVPEPSPSEPPPSFVVRPRIEDGPHFQPEVSATARGSVGLAPSPSLGLALGVALRRRPWSIGVEGRYDPSSVGQVDANVRLSIALLGASLLPCASWRALFGCATFTIGRLSAASSGIRNPASDEALFVSMGARVGAEVEATAALAFRAALDVAAAPIAHGAQVGLREVYETRVLHGSLGTSAVVRF